MCYLKEQHNHYLWDGNRQLQEQTDTHVFTTVYEQDSFEPIARLVWLKADLLKSANDEIKKAERESWEPEPTLIPNIKVYHYHNDHLGTPNELTNQDGEVVWLADYEAWGNTAKVVWREEQLGQIQVSAEELQPLRFQGQFIDQETGLHYNRFRYFDPDLGMFTTRDPIGLLGGDNVFQYAPNPIGWIDPFGLSKLPAAGEDLFVGTYSQSRYGNIKSGLNATHTPHHAIQNAASPASHGRGITINISKELHAKTWTFRTPMVQGLTNRQRLARDVKDLRKILLDAGYDRKLVNQQLKELIRQNKELWKNSCT